MEKEWNLNLYLLRKVRVTLNGQEPFLGQLKKVSPDTIQVDMSEYPLSTVKDIELVDGITDYHTYKGYGEIGGAVFKLDDIHSETDQNKVLYGEFDCEAACHLYFKNKKIYACDVQLLSKSHRIYEPELGQDYYLYWFADGQYLVGKLQKGADGYALKVLSGHEHPMDMKAVVDITKAPAVNEYVYIQQKNKPSVNGLVSASVETGLVLIDDDMESHVIDYADVSSIRFRGFFVEQKQNKNQLYKYRLSVKEDTSKGTFLCKEAYFQDPQEFQDISKESLASFAAGVTDKGIIAKDIELEEEGEGILYDGKGVIYFTSKQNSGYIAKEYVSKGYSENRQGDKDQGRISFKPRQIDEFPPHEVGDVYIVSYSCMGDPEKVTGKVKSISFEQKFKGEEYARIWINEDNQAETKPFFAYYLKTNARNIIGKFIELQMKDGTVHSGNLKSYNEASETLLFLDMEMGQEKAVLLDDIQKMRFQGMVTALRSDGTGHIDTHVWFHLGSFRGGTINAGNDLAEKAKVMYDIVYNEEKQGIRASDIVRCYSKVYEGYVLKYIATGVGYGFIVPKEELEQHLKDGDQTGSIYFRSMEIENITEFEMNTLADYYHVQYSLNERGNACNIRILKRIPLPKGWKVKGKVENRESLLVRMKDLSMHYVPADSDSDIDEEDIECKYYFGIVTAFDMNGSKAVINNMYEVGLDVMDSKLINILKNQMNLVRLHVIYAREGNRIIEVCRLSEEHLKLLKWEEKTVTRCDDNEKMLIVDGEIRHCISVLSDGMVSRRFKTDNFVGQPVYIRRVFHLYKDKNGRAGTPRLIQSAVDVHCKAEDADIKYNDARGSIMGYRDATHFYPLSGDQDILIEWIDQRAKIEFRLTADHFNLKAWLEEDKSSNFEEYMEESASDNTAVEKIIEEPLIDFCLRQIDIYKLLREQNIFSDEEDMPSNEQDILSDAEWAKKAYETLNKNPLAGAKIKMAIGWNEIDSGRKTEISDMLIKGLEERCKRIVMDPNMVFDEHAYHLFVLLRYTESRHKKDYYDRLYRLFLQDFTSASGMELSNYYSKSRSKHDIADKAKLEELFQNSCAEKDNLMAHLIALDKRSLGTVCDCLKNNPNLENKMREFAKELVSDSSQEKSLQDIVNILRKKYEDAKRKFTDSWKMCLLKNKISGELMRIITDMDNGFLGMMCKDDAERFRKLKEICTSISPYIQKGEVPWSRLEILRLQYRELCRLEKEVIEHPCRESVEIMMSEVQEKTALNKLKEEIAELLNSLFQDVSRMPQITCEPNSPTIGEQEVQKIHLIVKNGTSEMSRQPVTNIKFRFQTHTEGINVTEECELSSLESGEGDFLTIDLVKDIRELKTINIGWTAKFEYITRFDFDKGELIKMEDASEGGIIQLEIDTQQKVDKEGKENPYKDDMFFGREEEQKEIRDSIMKKENGEEEFIPGKAVIIHGQKQNGKTSLVNQIRKYIEKSDDLSERAIILSFSMLDYKSIDDFTKTFYAAVLSQFKRKISRDHPDVEELLEKNGLSIPNLWEENASWVNLFNDFFSDFHEYDKGRHTVVLLIDEFTVLCAKIRERIIEEKSRAEEYKSILYFIKTFSEFGFIQIIIGHATMMEVLDSLGVLNHTAEFAKLMEVSALDEEASRSLVREPMIREFGFDTYNTEMGKQAIEKLLDLSGRNPAYLKQLCKEMFAYYIDDSKCPHAQIVIDDVEKMVKEYIGKDELSLVNFDILTGEDGDEMGDTEERRTYHYLKCTARCGIARNSRDAAIEDIKSAMCNQYGYSDDEIEKIRNLLEKRRVIFTSNAHVTIKVGLFVEYIRQKYGKY